MVSPNENLELTELIGRRRHPPKHQIRIGVSRGGVNPGRFDRGHRELKLGPMAALGDKIADKRIVERNIAKGLISKEDYERRLAELPDREGAYERVEVEPGEPRTDHLGE